MLKRCVLALAICLVSQPAFSRSAHDKAADMVWGVVGTVIGVGCFATSYSYYDKSSKATNSIPNAKTPEEKSALEESVKSNSGQAGIWAVGGIVGAAVGYHFFKKALSDPSSTGLLNYRNGELAMAFPSVRMDFEKVQVSLAKANF